MSDPKVSVIVPIYNVEAYIGRCVRSIRQQTFRDFEVLLIDDGTPDHSIEEAQKIIGDDPRFTVYHKENGGLSDARNYGLERARGEYIVFIDSDDFIDRDYIRILYNECILNDAQISCCRYRLHFTDCISLPVPVGKRVSVLEAKKALDLLIRDNQMQSFAWNKMYKRSLFNENGITYPVMYFEDVATTPRVMFFADRVAITDRYLYSYVRRFDSILSTMNVKKINDYIHAYHIIRLFLEQHDAYRVYRDALQSVSRKVSLINVYSILREHMIARNPEGAAENLRRNFRLFRRLNTDICPPDDTLPEQIEQPVRQQ